MAPELVFYRDGQVEGVKYDRIAVVLINAVKSSRRRLNSKRNSPSDNRSKINRQEDQARLQRAAFAATVRRFQETGMPDALARSGVPMKK